MDTLGGRSRLDVEWTRLFDKFCKAEESFPIRKAWYKEGGNQNVHALHVSEAELLG